MALDTDTAATPAAGQLVERERRGNALWLWLNSPDVLNAITPTLLDALDDALDAAATDDEVCCVVIAGRGRAFCAGADLGVVQGLLDAGTPTGGLRTAKQGLLRRVSRTLDAIDAFGKPVLAAVHGIAVAGGLELALCCDVVIAAESASFGDGHTNYGLLPGAGGSVRLPRRVGHATAKRLLFTGDVLSARDLLHTDLVEEVVADDELIGHVDAFAARIATKSPLVVRLANRLVDDGMQVPLDVALRMERHVCELLEQSLDEREGVAAFREKRAPLFVGR